MANTRTEFDGYTEEVLEPDAPNGHGDGAAGGTAEQATASNGHGNGAGPTSTTIDEDGKGPWPIMAPAAYRGLAGEVVATIAPHTESDNVALLLHYLAYFGNVLGRKAYFQVESTKHFGNLFTIPTGRTSRSRKGTAADRILHVFRVAAPDWARDCIKAGMSSGEGMIFPIRDPVTAMRKGVLETIDPGVADKRLLLAEREFYRALAVMKREGGGTLSDTVRNAWDCCERLGSLTKHSPTVATEPYISIVGHITADELREHLDQTAMLNGYANRFLFVCVRRSKALPHGGSLREEEIENLGHKTRAAVEAVRAIERVTMTPEAERFWDELYPRLTEDRPGLFGAICARGEAQTIRLALLYALLDGAAQIDVWHLEAASAVWDYCADSARYIFGEGDEVTNTILRELQLAGAEGISRTDLYRLFGHGRQVSSGQIVEKLVRLQKQNRVRCERQPPRFGRPREMWFAQ